MEKTIKSLAALAVLMAATLLASCDKAEQEAALLDRVVSVTIAPPPSSDVETKVYTADNGTKVSINGWETGDAVNLYKVTYDGTWKASEVTFTCSDPISGTFTGTLPSGIESVDELNLALFNCEMDPENPLSDGAALVHYTTKASKNLKDVVAMAAVRSDGKFTMKVVNNIAKVRNTTLSDIDAAWKVRRVFDMTLTEQSYVSDMVCSIDVSSGAVAYHQLPTLAVSADNFDKCKFTLKSKTDCYLSLCPGNSSAPYTIGLSAKDDSALGSSLMGTKLVSAISSTGGKLYTAPDILPKGAMHGVFSVASLPQKRVHFSKGNLYYTGSAWAFESNQYDYRSWHGKNACIQGTITTDGTPTGNVGLFHWTGVTANSYAYSYSGISSDKTFFANTDDSVMGSIWKALTKEEWEFLLNSRTGAADKAGYATVCGVCGLILLPDTFTDPMKNGGSGAFVPKSTFYYTANTYTEDDWNAMEKAGAVFLPAAGYRFENMIYGIQQGSYWTADAYGNDIDAYALFFSGNVLDVEIHQCNYGNAIRLVTAAE